MLHWSDSACAGMVGSNDCKLLYWPSDDRETELVVEPPHWANLNFLALCFFPTANFILLVLGPVRSPSMVFPKVDDAFASVNLVDRRLGIALIISTYV